MQQQHGKLMPEHEHLQLAGVKLTTPVGHKKITINRCGESIDSAADAGRLGFLTHKTRIFGATAATGRGDATA